MAAEFHLLCAGAVKGLVLAVQPAFESAAGVRLRAQFGAVGAMRDALGAGAACDAFVATEAMIGSLVASGALRVGSSAAIGRVQTGIAVRADQPLPAIDSAATLKSTLLAAEAVYLPDAERSTAGAHFVAVLDRLAIRATLAPRLRIYPNGAAAMRELAAASEPTVIGCTQATEICYTPGLVLVGALPPPFALATVYSGAVATAASDDSVARHLIELLAGAGSAALRSAGGFDPIVERR